jgi:hypothetical protein
MADRNELIDSEAGISWQQIVRGEDNHPISSRSFSMRDATRRTDLDRIVQEFADFCKATPGGDELASIGVAMNEINKQSRELLNKLDLTEKEDDIRKDEPLLDAALSLFKALDRYYVQMCGLKTGTAGD